MAFISEKIQQFFGFPGHLSGEVSVPFASVSKFSAVLVEWKAPKLGLVWREGGLVLRKKCNSVCKWEEH